MSTTCSARSISWPEAGSFSAAARACGVSQPTLSGQVKALEKAYGVRLFDRRGRSVSPTRRPAACMGSPRGCSPPRTRRARCWPAAGAAARASADRRRQRHHVMPIMATVKARHTGLTFALAIGNSADVVERLLDYDADVAVMAKRVSDPRLHSRCSGTTGWCCSCAPPYAGAPRAPFRSAPCRARPCAARARLDHARGVRGAALRRRACGRTPRRGADARGGARGGAGRLRRGRRVRGGAAQPARFRAGRWSRTPTSRSLNTWSACRSADAWRWCAPSLPPVDRPRRWTIAFTTAPMHATPTCFQHEPPNMLLITVDQWHGDLLGSARHPFARTPNLDAVARQGTRFTQHYCQVYPCGPARAGLVTGLTGGEHEPQAKRA